MKLSANDMKAIGWFCKTYNLRPQLSIPPQMHFLDQAGVASTRSLDAIISEYKSWNEEDKKIRARENAAERAAELRQKRPRVV